MFNKDLKKQIKDLELKNDFLAIDLKGLKERRYDEARAHEIKVEALNDQLNRKECRIEVLEALVEKTSDLQVKEIDLDQREKLLEANEANADNIKEKLAEATAKGEELAEKKYQAGYADGLADGLRKAHEITAEDRKHGMQIAALAAASHQPDATKQIAAAIAQDVTRALPASTKKK